MKRTFLRKGTKLTNSIARGELKDFADAHPFSIRDTARLAARAKGKGLAGWGEAAQVLPDF